MIFCSPFYISKPPYNSHPPTVAILGRVKQPIRKLLKILQETDYQNPNWRQTSHNTKMQLSIDLQHMQLRIL